MRNLLLSEAVGDIAGSVYEFEGRTKDYDAVDLMNSNAEFTDDTVCTFACAEALLYGKDIATNLWLRCRKHPYCGYGGRFARWVYAPQIEPAYNSFGNGSAMRCSAAGWMAKSEEECIELATATALPTHNHPEGIKGAVATALTIWHLNNGKSKEYVRETILGEYYPEWKDLNYNDIHDDYDFDETCQKTVPAAILCLLQSKGYEDCLKLAIALGGDADTLGAISGPMAYACYKEIPDNLIEYAKKNLPQWMLVVNENFDDKFGS